MSVLRTAFGYPYAETAEVLGRSEAGCRQLHRRATQRIGGPARPSQAGPGRWRALTERFLAAAAGIEPGDVVVERFLPKMSRLVYLRPFSFRGCRSTGN